MKSLRRLLAAFALAVPVLASAQSADKPFTNEQLDQMLAQVALYPDALLSQVLMASTYPDEFQEAAAWSKANPDAKGDDAVKQVESKNWDPSVASLVAFPEVLITLGEKPDYVKNLGDAFLAQPDDVMISVQRLRAAAQKSGNLASNEQIKVTVDPTPPLQESTTPPPTTTTTVVQAPPVTQTIIIEPAQPQVVYVPQYNPTVVYGTWWWPSYPPYYYPPPPGYWWSPVGGAFARGIAWGAGFAVGNALWGGCNWRRGDVDINVNRYNNVNVNRRIDANVSRTNWSHNTEHRKTAYRGGDAQRQNLQNKAASVNREQFRGKDVASRDASRERAQQAMQQRGVDPGSGSARERAQGVDRSQVDRAQAQQRAQNVDRSAAQQRAQNADRSAAQQRAQNVDRDAARQRAASADRSAAQQRAQSASRDNAMRGAGSSNARAQQARGSASAASAQRASGGGARAGGGGGARGGGGGARGGGGRGR